MTFWQKTIAEIRLDLEAICAKARPFIVCLTDVQTGRAVYRRTDARNLEAVLKATSALPILYRGFPVIDGRATLDGGIADRIPVCAALKRGARRIMVVRSRPRRYIKRARLSHALLLARLLGHADLRKAAAGRVRRYNAVLAVVRRPPDGVSIVEICPPDDFRPTRLGRDREILIQGYRQGAKPGTRGRRMVGHRLPEPAPACMHAVGTIWAARETVNPDALNQRGMTSMTKLLLINPPISIYINKTAFAPLPLLILGTRLKALQQTGMPIAYDLMDLDFMLKKGVLADDPSFYPEASRLILDSRPDILLFTVHGLNHVIILKLAAIIKKTRPSAFIIVGGVGPTLKARQALERCPDIDIVVKGEGEPVLGRLIAEIVGNRDFSTVPSIVYRRNGEVVENPRRFLSPEDPFPKPDYSLVRMAEYTDHNRAHPYVHPGFVLIESGRGCPHACAFCAPAKMWGSTVRYRPIPEIIEEMRFLARQGGDFSFFTQDNLEEKFMRALSEALVKGNVAISWGCYSRLDRLSDEIAPLLSKAGCRLIFTGFETPNRSTQKAIRKVLSSSDAFTKLQHYNRHGIKLICSFIAGFPDESEDDLANTMQFALECSTGMRCDELIRYMAATPQPELPQHGRNICFIHTLSYLPGTDAFEKAADTLHIAKHSLHPDCHGSYLFAYEHYKDDWSFLGANPYLNHLPEDRLRYYCAILRLFNFLNSRPFYFAQLLSTLQKSPLTLVERMAAHLGEEFVLTAKIKAFEQEARAFVARYLAYTPEWTVKKGQ
ncbi:MAG TPA: radical SAM protein [Desulfosarcina sp.]|nr:radical SAM protein [Desulfosarcina sp.]